VPQKETWYGNDPENCVGGNFSQAAGKPKAWGWAAQTCAAPHVYMCRNTSAWRGQPVMHWAAAAPFALAKRARACCQDQPAVSPEICAPPPAPPAACGKYSYFSSATNNTYSLNTCDTNFFDAENDCMNGGGHLASWHSLQEQQLVEQYYITYGAITPGFHKFYWMGMNTQEWPAFKWVDGSPFLNNSLTYQHWGYFMPQNIKEPNNLIPPELCIGANYTEAYRNTWAWADTNCGDAYPYICMNTRGWSRPRSACRH
jgi:hypothetical protein